MIIAGIPMSEDDILQQVENKASSSAGSVMDRQHNFITNSQYGQHSNPLEDFWDSVTGKANTDATNSATYAMQKDAQAFNAAEAEKDRLFSAEQAEIARQWQEQMSNSAYQRSVSDLKAAGLNPWLAASTSGASTGSVGIPNADSASSAQGSGINATKSGAELLAMAGITAASIIKIVKMLR